MINNALVLIKPDGIRKAIVGNVLTKLSETKLDILGIKIVKVTKNLARQHYQNLKDKPFFENLLNYIQGNIYEIPCNKILAFIYHGENAILRIRDIIGDTNPEKAKPTSIRGAYGRITTNGLFENVIHCSSDLIEAEREIKLWFKPEEILMEIYPTKEIITQEKKRVWL
ncbi:MAG: nucleoside-diphosphate kinase [Endomicrobium sp.]|jgi:nucleoside-diphosphate kinase|nr:nucleoside-diphosphate kinase [Endomicrobium sp.]